MELETAQELISKFSKKYAQSQAAVYAVQPIQPILIAAILTALESIEQRLAKLEDESS